ncbi:MAG: carbohydrate ABC transporter permease [Acidimicrobiaceae bacterium]|nr:carbohydrate ABC transporter permease [Acidimicrobiaceae bacterium]MDE0666183.1 carbohydrate ABC transporter permease [Acidimicrobiaceae bacterium]MXY11149.1 carbohydrate ABC transporter permease [Acidimicrobiaceae bacterium]MXZ65580.1 carbohydrate ABC transporter permease [Acidimicrobiaceae bacterium]MYF33168.1 carbohydrate ABC transporter permease [Acidimicrobiaceae bacterium]
MATTVAVGHAGEGVEGPRHSGWRRLQRPVTYSVMVLLAIFFVFPVVAMVVLSLQPDETQVIADQDSIWAFFPRALSLQNYEDVFGRDVGRAVFNSALITVVTVGLGLVVNSMCAYGLARLQWIGRNVVIGLVVALMIVPFQSVSVPLLLIVNRLGWLDTYHVQIIPFVANPFFIFLFYQSFIGLPKAIEEAALIDGAGRWTIYRRIVVPLSRPTFATVGILQALFVWGSFFWPLMVTRGPDVRPLPVAMQVLFSDPNVPLGDVFAFAAVMTLPVLALYLLFQKWFVQSVASQGLKG